MVMVPRTCNRVVCVCVCVFAVFRDIVIAQEVPVEPHALGSSFPRRAYPLCSDPAVLPTDEEKILYINGN